MNDQSLDPAGLLKCPSCGTKVPSLFKLTADDIQRRFSPEETGFYMRVCSDCVNSLRRAARLEVRYKSKEMLRNASFTIPPLSLAFYALFRTWTGPVFLITTVIFLTAGATVFKETGQRYAYTHNLVWSLRNRRVTIGFSITCAIIIAAALSQIARFG